MTGAKSAFSGGLGCYVVRPWAFLHTVTSVPLPPPPFDPINELLWCLGRPSKATSPGSPLVSFSSCPPQVQALAPSSFSSSSGSSCLGFGQDLEKRGHPAKEPVKVAELAQLKSESPLCLLRAEFPSIAGVEDRLNLGRTPRSYASGSHAGRSAGTGLTVDIAALLKAQGSHESSVSPPRHVHPAPQPPSIKSSTAPPRPVVHVAPLPVVQIQMPTGRRSMPAHGADQQPVKKQSKWSPEEDALIIELRGSGMKWEDISKRLPGRSAISCRLHYQNYLERRSEWDEERKNKLARLYERFKPEMWAKVAEEMAVPWRAAEAMHWQLGEADMARRAGVIPFSLAAVNVDSNNGHRNSPSRSHVHPHSHSHSHSQGSMPRDLRAPSPRVIYNRAPTMPPVASSRTIVSRLESIPPPPPLSMGPDPNEVHYVPGPGLAPIQNQPPPRSTGMLPGVDELTTGVSPYCAPARGPSAGSIVSSGQGPLFSSLASYSMESAGKKRRASSPDRLQHEANHRRRLV
ncbi:hypothetical protein FZEAL_1391 [Fusarium zealandicum]|uniref:MYB DNA-binding domain-containing protein n=1 Tax=Fusarium zealandicum TaxID=1053134 RepID=A0A8H4UST2_9HYPO|nr:hypothetical protein FZEAL_1391 [Fusarium zealandicum]